jgi:hypothetical protein
MGGMEACVCVGICAPSPTAEYYRIRAMYYHPLGVSLVGSSEVEIRPRRPHPPGTPRLCHPLLPPLLFLLFVPTVPQQNW